MLTHRETLELRLWVACDRLPDFGGGLWARGIRKIHEKFGYPLWYSNFAPAAHRGDIPGNPYSWNQATARWEAGS